METEVLSTANAIKAVGKARKVPAAVYSDRTSTEVLEGMDNITVIAASAKYNKRIVIHTWIAEGTFKSELKVSYIKNGLPLNKYIGCSLTDAVAAFNAI